MPVLYESSNDAYAVSDVPMSIRVEYNAGEPASDVKNTITGETVPHITAIVPNHSPNSPSNILNLIKFTRADIYARYAEIDVQRVDSSVTSQRFGIQLAGTGLEEDNQVVECSVSSVGEVCEIDNPILAGTQQIKNVAEWAAAYLKNRNIYEVDFRQDFRLEPNDVITFQTQFEKNIPVRITRIQFKIPGQAGAICVRRLS